MRGLRTWRGSVMALCVAVALAGLTASSTLANEPKPETASGPPEDSAKLLQTVLCRIPLPSRRKLRPHVRNLWPAKWARRNRKK